VPLLNTQFFRFTAVLYSTTVARQCQRSFGGRKVTSRKGLAYCLSFFLGVFGISGCSNTSLKSAAEQELELHYHTIKTDRFTLSGVAKAQKQNTMRIYLGGDGKPWRKNEPNTNPSGHNKLAFQLFKIDPKATLYLSRPCYDIEPMPSDCKPKLWTSDRYSNRVIMALTEAIMKVASNSNIELVGYSGGGTLAVLLAQQLPQVTKVLTLSANLDQAAWTDLHNTPALSGSENPAVNGERITGKELHLFGHNDLEVPAAINQRYFDNNPAANIGVIDNFDHRCCWLEQWPEILNSWETGLDLKP
jgi:hypothetical protein